MSQVSILTNLWVQQNFVAGGGTVADLPDVAAVPGSVMFPLSLLERLVGDLLGHLRGGRG